MESLFLSTGQIEKSPVAPLLAVTGSNTGFVL